MSAPVPPSLLNPNIELGSHLKFLAETPDLIAVAKPAGIHCAPQNTKESTTVLNALLALRPNVGIHPGAGTPPLEGTLLHRLDQGTSGVLLFAAQSAVHTPLRTLWQTHALEKDYIAWVHGALKFSGPITLQLCHSPKSKKRMLAVETLSPAAARAVDKTYKAESIITPLLRTTEHTLVAVRINTGVMHQIRVTLAALGHPILNDPIYKSAARKLNPKSVTNKFIIPTPKLVKSAAPHSELLPENGFFLHAYRIALKPEHKTSSVKLHASTVKILRNGITCPLPYWFGATE